MSANHLLKKYNHEVPRYTSYPTVPFWREELDVEAYLNAFRENFEQHNDASGISLYIHLPFCESLCTYCGCNKVITKNHGVEEGYLNAIISEWYLYRKLMRTAPVIRELHLGGGTPTFFSPENLRRLLNCIFDIADIHPHREFSIEGHPNNTSRAHLEMLHQFGFTRLSLGVQDHDPRVQRVINRIQPYENVQRVTEMAREEGFTSINYDLIYGLPLQTLKSVKKTTEETIALHPDRIAYYSYAHIPGKIKSQRHYAESDLPSPELKAAFYLLAKGLFLDSGYKAIGMDHFTLQRDKLYAAFQEGRLYRNFMGYTATVSPFMIGLGVSAISDIGIGYVQNSKKLAHYYKKLNQSKLPIERGCLLTDTDMALRNYIMDIACKGATTFRPADELLLKTQVMPQLQEMVEDKLIVLDQYKLQVTEIGRPFLRNICSAFDLQLNPDRSEKANLCFSRSI